MASRPEFSNVVRGRPDAPLDYHGQTSRQWGQGRRLPSWCSMHPDGVCRFYGSATMS